MPVLVTSINRLTNAQACCVSASPSISTEKAPRRGWSERFRKMLQSAPGTESGTPRVWAVLLASVLVTSILLTVPAVAPDLGVDASWCAVLNWAHRAGLQFGKEIVFTYGPLGYLIAPYTLSRVPESLLAFNTAFCFGISAAICLVARRLGLFWRCLFVGVAVFGSANTELRADLLLQLGLFCWGLLSIIESGGSKKLCCLAFIVLATFAALAKVVYVFIAGFSLCAIACLAWWSGEIWVACSLLPAFFAVLLMGWMAAGQTLSNLGPYVFSGFLFSRDYDQAVGLGGLQTLRNYAVILGVIVAIAAVLRTGDAWEHGSVHVRKRRLVLAAWVAGILFFAWKHSVVRLDRDHFTEFAIFSPVVLTGLELLTVSGTNQRRAARWLTLIGSGLALAVLQFAFLTGPLGGIKQVFEQANVHIRCLICPSVWRQGIEEGLRKMAEEARLPRLAPLIRSHTVDIFGLHQSYAVLNGLNYKPRPVFQSYAAFTARLSAINEDFYRSDRAPEFVLFELASLEHRFPALDDARALRELLANYQWIASEGPFQLLQHRPGKALRLKLLEQKEVPLTARMVLPQHHGETMWLEIDLKPSVYGRLLGFLYRPEPIRLSAWENENSPKAMMRRQAAPSLLRSGFLASPWLMKAEDVKELQNGNRPPGPQAFSLEPGPGTDWLWENQVIWRVYEEAGGKPEER
jgi:hypothetical protein